MSNLLDIEEEGKSLPILCLFGDEPELQKQFLDENFKKFRIIIVADKKPYFLSDFTDIYFLTYKDAVLLPNLKETIEYSIAFVSSENTLANINPLLEKCTADKSQTIIAIKIFMVIKSFQLIDTQRVNANVRFAILGELLSSRSTDERSILSKIIENAIAKREVQLIDSEASVFPISKRDAINGISRLLFGSFHPGRIYNLFYKDPQNILGVAHAIGRLEPEIKIIFTDVKSATHTFSREELNQVCLSNLRMEQTYLESAFHGFDTELIQILDEKVTEEDPIPLKKTIKRRERKGSFSKAISFTVLSLLFGVSLFLFANLLFFGIGLLSLKSAVEGIQSNNFKTVVQDAKTARFFLTAIKPTANITFDTLGLLGQQEKVQQAFILLDRIVTISEVAGKTFAKISNQVPDSESKLASTMSDLSYLYKEGQRIGIETQNPILKKQLKHTYSKALSFSEVLPGILGYDGEKNYLLLFQNDAELRPTGGFIGSIGNLTMSNGLVKKLTIQDVYEPDGQLRNHIEPPYVVRRYLQQHLYLRDSNFFLNFQETASMSAYIYNLETGNKPDGVIAINLEVLKRIIGIIGSVKLDEYNVTVNKDNIASFIQNKIKDDFFPGSTQKKDILNRVMTKIIEEASTKPQVSAQILKLVPDLMEEKNIQFSFSDNSVQKMFSANKYAGEYIDTRVSDPKNINDFLYVNEANIGVNKVNASITRDITYEAMLGSSNTLNSKLNLNITNTNQKDSYTTYIHVVAPPGSAIKQILINGVKQSVVPTQTDFNIYEADGYTKPEGLEVEQYAKDNHTHFAFTTIVPARGKNMILVEYANGAAKSIGTITKYSLQYIKQSGTPPYKTTTIVNYPEGYSPVNTDADSYGKNFLKQERTISTDFITEIELRKM